EQVEEAARSQFHTIDLAAEAKRDAVRGNDNVRVVQEARELQPGEVRVLLQARLHVSVDGWLLTGDADLLRLERLPEGTLQVLIADAKSSTSAKVEHRLQVAFYDAMLARLLEQEHV